MLKRLSLLMVLGLMWALSTGQALAVEGYSQRCDWCVAAGFWENVIRGNDRCADYVDESVKPAALALSAQFRQVLQKKCGDKFDDGHVESDFNYSSLGGKVQVKGKAWTDCRGRRKDFLTENMQITTTKDRNGIWAVTIVDYVLKMDQPKKKKKSKK